MDAAGLVLVGLIVVLGLAVVFLAGERSSWKARAEASEAAQKAAEQGLALAQSAAKMAQERQARALEVVRGQRREADDARAKERLEKGDVGAARSRLRDAGRVLRPVPPPKGGDEGGNGGGAA